MTKQPLTLEIKGNTLDDGPGIRSVVFFKGCPLACSWCHNPESKSQQVEISFDPEACVGSHACFSACPKEAISLDNPFFIDRTACDLCFKCVEQCPSGALTRVGDEMSVSEISNTVMKDKPFFDSSKGGVTFSGGEPTLNMGFLAEAAKDLKSKGLHVLLETCGLFNYDQFIDLVYPYIDTIYFDIKIIDNERHKKYCGSPNTNILKNFRKLQQRYLDGGVEILPRTPLVPNITDTPENLAAIASFYKETQVSKTQLLAYHPMWQNKNLKIGVKASPDMQLGSPADSPEKADNGLIKRLMNSSLRRNDGVQSASEANDDLDKWMPSQRVSECEKIFTNMGIQVS